MLPSYQRDFGLAPATADPAHLVGRGAPDVSANAGGNLFYGVPQAGMNGLRGAGGTSASAPLWAALISQFNALFRDQGLPSLGYMNDLLYIAAAIAPASFNDVTLGNNVSSFALGGAYSDAETGTAITPTGYGYYAGPGYDLATGLGSPNGLLLARALTDIAHSQMSFHSSSHVIDSNGQGGWTSGADQSLLFQTMSDDVAQVGVHLGRDSLGFLGTPSARFAWTTRMAEQSLQADFDPALVVMFDKQTQGSVAQAHVSAGQGLSISIDAASTQALQAALSSPFGFADFSPVTVRCGWRVRWRWRRRPAVTTTRPRSCGCARAGRTTCRSPSTGSTISTAQSTACIRVTPATKPRCRAAPIR